MNAVHFQTIVAIIVAIGLGLALPDDPIAGAPGLNVYIWLGTAVGLLFAGMYILVNLACIGYFMRERRSEFNPLKHLVVPILGVIAMIPAVLAVIGGVTIPILDVELAPYENSLRFTAPVVGVWVAARDRRCTSCSADEPGRARSGGRRLRWRRGSCGRAGSY